MKNFELFMCCLGNGVTACNKAVMENGDYKQIAHISNCGKITWYVEPSKIPGDALLKIEHDADAMNENFEKLNIAENWLRANEVISNEEYNDLMMTLSYISRELYRQ